MNDSKSHSFIFILFALFLLQTDSVYYKNINNSINLSFFFLFFKFSLSFWLHCYRTSTKTKNFFTLQSFSLQPHKFSACSVWMFIYIFDNVLNSKPLIHSQNDLTKLLLYWGSIAPCIQKLYMILLLLL